MAGYQHFTSMFRTFTSLYKLQNYKENMFQMTAQGMKIVLWI